MRKTLHGISNKHRCKERTPLHCSVFTALGFAIRQSNTTALCDRAWCKMSALRDWWMELHVRLRTIWPTQRPITKLRKQTSEAHRDRIINLRQGIS